ncbi:hypothetical protein SLS57_011975 [Botryosphaeria dothidea]
MVLLYNGDHSDLTLVSSDGHEFHVHVAILHCGSLYFRTAMKQKWKETENKRFELDDDSVTLKAILEYIYSQGQCYSVPVTCSQQLEQHAAIYFAADFYGISDLKKFSQRQFLGLVEKKPEGWDKAMKAWPTVVRAMYEHDVPTTTSLKNEILRLTWDHLAALEEEQGFQGLLDEVPAFSSDMFKLARARRVRENLCDFIRLFNFEWKEDISAVANIDASYSSKVTKAMLDFTYTGSYAKDVKNYGCPESLQLHIGVQVIADYYKVVNLGRYAQERFLDVVQDTKNWDKVKKA